MCEGVDTMTYYDAIAKGYDELHKEEQLKKLALCQKQGLIQKTDALLDVGCGTAFSLDYFDVREAYGIDPAKELLKQYKGDGIVMQGVAEDLPFEDNRFDSVVSLTAMQNFSNVVKACQEMRRVGKDRFLLSVLKKSPHCASIEEQVREVFHDFAISRLEEEKDYLFVIKKERDE